jgi:hypothetical protein
VNNLRNDSEILDLEDFNILALCSNKFENLGSLTSADTTGSLFKTLLLLCTGFNEVIKLLKIEENKLLKLVCSN